MHRDQTAMGGQDGRFHTTQWTQIHAMSRMDEAQQCLLLEQLVGRYWKPVYCYLRRKGYDNDRAKDLTQGFFSEVVLDRNLVGRADPGRGKFRTLLLTALDRYVVDLHRRDQAHKRSPEKDLIVWDTQIMGDLPETATTEDPEQAFIYAWASNLLDEALAILENECHADGKSLHWKVFYARVLAPIFEDADPPVLEDLCSELGIQVPSQVSNMIVTVKRRFKGVLERCLRDQVHTEDQVAQEWQDLINILSGDRARSI